MNVKVLRVKRRLSQEELAAESGIERTYLGGIERGLHNVSLKTILKLAGALKCKLEELLDGIKPIKRMSD